MNMKTIDQLLITRNVLDALLNSDPLADEAKSYQAQIEALTAVIKALTRPSTDYEQAMSGRSLMLKSTVAWHE